ncbi:HECT-type E3 ubiquitin transferase [Malassezia nana]|uniref:HECT-type E3 ubiquitin transferase n=1 Tax=Malassezia nana TaxID=180528 RepID=A0AAF0J3E3_9BASI|nr:HECT-type E3 ubiquitin transferase [Malassezia nana]
MSSPKDHARCKSLGRETPKEEEEEADEWLDEELDADEAATMEEDVDADELDGPLGLHLHGLRSLLGGASRPFQEKLRQLRATAHQPAMRLVALQELADALSVATEDVFMGQFPLDALVRELLWTLGGPEPEGHVISDMDGDDELAAVLAASGGDGDGDGEAQMYACRSLAYMIEALPESSHCMVRRGVVPLLVHKLCEITFIDLAEQVQQTLEKLAATHPAVVAREGGMLAAVQYLDFFNIYVQRTALHTVAQCARRVTPGAMTERVLEVAPILAQVLAYSDGRIVESACRSVCSITEAFIDDKALVSLLTAWIAPLCNLLARGVGRDTNTLPLLPGPLMADVLQILAQAARSHTQIAEALYKHGILETMYVLLTGAPPDGGDVPQPAVLQQLAHRLPAEIDAALGLLVDLLPPLPCDGLFDSRMYGEKAYMQKKRRAERAGCAIGELDDALDDTPARRLSASAMRQQRETEARAEAQRAWPSFFERYAKLLLPMFLSVCTASVSLGVRKAVLSAMLRTLWYTDPAALTPALEQLPLASFYTGILSSHDHPACVEAALQGIELLLTRLPYQVHFLRQGTMHQVQRLAEAGEPNYRAKLLWARMCAAPEDAALTQARETAATLGRLAAQLDEGQDTAKGLEALASLLPSLTSFELECAGLLDTLYRFGTQNDGPMPVDERRKQLSDLLEPAAKPLLDCLHASLTRAETLTVESAGSSSSITQQKRVRLVAGEDSAERVPRGYREMVISIHAIVSVRTLHDFLHPKLELLMGALRPSDLSGALAALVGKEEEASSSYASAAQSSKTAWHLAFELDGEPMPYEATLYQCLRTDAACDSQALPVITYTIVPGPIPAVQAPALEPPLPFAPGYEVTLPPSLATDAPYARTLQLLGMLHDLWEETVPCTSFVNTKLTAKLAQQLQEPLVLASRCQPAWVKELPRTHSFLFPFETRWKYLQLTSLGYARLLGQWNKVSADETLAALAQLPRQKVRIARATLLASAIKVLDLYANAQTVLEVEYFDEVGSGLGPTLEFYALVSRELQRTELGLWRHDSSVQSEYVQSVGLFPAPVGDDDRKRVLTHFRALGQLIAKALLDGRIVDVPFHVLFWRAVLRRRVPRTLSTLRQVDPSMAQSLEALERMSADDIAALELDGTLPGTSLVLPGWRREDTVTQERVHDYIQAIIDMCLAEGIAPQLDAFREGFDGVLPLVALDVFQSKELVTLFGQSQEDWDLATLQRTVVPDHGFTSESSHFQDLLAILASFSLDERRTLLQWLTGSPRLPVGGFAALQPPLTVVRRQPEPPLQPNDYLPSVMTCVNYLKLPR